MNLNSRFTVSVGFFSISSYLSCFFILKEMTKKILSKHVTESTVTQAFEKLLSFSRVEGKRKYLPTSIGRNQRPRKHRRKK
jgi:hypothetical protein